MDINQAALVEPRNSSTPASKPPRSEKYSDLIISCHAREFKVHRTILCPQSEVISKLCDIDMQERKTGIIEHEEFDDDAMERMIDFAYVKDYEATRRPKHLLSGDGEEETSLHTEALAIEDVSAAGCVTLPENDDAMPATDNERTELSATDRWIIHARVYGLADYYDMSELRELAHSRFMAVADEQATEADLNDLIYVAREVCRRTTAADGMIAIPYETSLRTGFLSLIARYASKLSLDSDFVAGLNEPDLLDIMSDVFCALGQRISELEAQKLEITESLEAENEALEQSLSTTKAYAATQVNTAQVLQNVADNQLQRTEGLMQHLVRSLRSLPATCYNNNCNNEFGSLKLERGGNQGNGDWQVRCGAKRCNCKLN
jgi:hypothetical protein